MLAGAQVSVIHVCPKVPVRSQGKPGCWSSPFSAMKTRSLVWLMPSLLVCEFLKALLPRSFILPYKNCVLTSRVFGASQILVLTLG